MTQFKTATAELARPDPAKRVNHTFGLVMGVPEFRQDQHYHLEKHRVHNRLLHGYGTVLGLKVHTGGSGSQPRLFVQPGQAVDPYGNDICVSREMCAALNDWTDSNRLAIEHLFGPPPTSVHVCVMLCHRECETDPVPIPGEPCRSQEDAVAPSRLTESFELRLELCQAAVGSPPVSSSPPGSPPAGTLGALAAPLGAEEPLIRELGRLLDSIEVTNDPAVSVLTVTEIEELVRRLGQTPGSPPGSPPLSPPVGGWAVLQDEACRLLDAAFRTWVTEVRPLVTSHQSLADCEATPDDCVLLADLRFDVAVDPVDGNWEVSGPVEVDESRRPYLLQTRVLQEWVTCVRDRSLAAGFTTAPNGSTHRTVAAGRFRPNGTAIGATFNNLTAPTAGTPVGDYTLMFDGYQLPTLAAGFTYIVKGVLDDTTATTPKPRGTLEFVQFGNTGIQIRIRDVDGNTEPYAFMVEVSEVRA